MARPGPLQHIAILDDYQGVAKSIVDWSVLPEAEISAFAHHIDDKEELVRALQPFEAIVAMRERTALPSDVLERLPQLRLIVTTGSRNASIDVDAARNLGIEVCGTGFIPGDTAELTWLLILASARNLSEEIDALRHGHWQSTLGTSLAGKRLGLIGLGRLGQRVAQVGLAFGMEVVAWSAHLTEEAATKVGVTHVTKEEVLRSSDVLSIHVVLSDRTRGLIGPRELALMKSDAILVNTSRAPIIDEDALVSALNSRTIAKAALDVFWDEPLAQNHPLRQLPNVLITPHIGYVTRENYQVFFRDAIEDIRAFQNGSTIRKVAHFDGRPA